jgi:hypothetical protein
VSWLAASVGRSDFIGQYRTDRHGKTAVKFSEREKVLRFLLENRNDCPRVKLLSMPGADWTFEQMLLRDQPMSQCVGIEKSFSVYSKSRTAMPWAACERDPIRKHLQDRSMRYGNSTIVYSRVASKLSDPNKRKRSVRSHRLLLMDAATFCSVLATDYGATIDQKREFASRFGYRNAAWLDFTSNLCPSVLDAFGSLPTLLSQGNVPVAITVLNGRDRFRGVANRIDALTAAQPLFKPMDFWTYAGGGGAPMLTVCGIFTDPYLVQSAEMRRRLTQ